MSDFREGRFESEIGVADLQKGDAFKRRSRVMFCNRCSKAFDESSRTVHGKVMPCPRCDKRNEVGVISQIPDRHVEEANRKAFRR